MHEWVTIVKAYSLAYQFDANVALAVAEVEGGKGETRFRFGRYGRYWLPFGIDFECNVPRPDTFGGNAEGGIKALARHLTKHGNLKAALRKYNTGDSPAQFERYYRRIRQLEARNREARIFE